MSTFRALRNFSVKKSNINHLAMNLQESIYFLEKSNHNFVEIYRDDIGQYIPSNQKKEVSLDMIPDRNLENFLKTYINNNTQDVIVMLQHKTLSGASKRTVGPPYHIKIKAINSTAPVTTTHQAEPMQQSTNKSEQFLGSPFGQLGFAEVIGMSVKAERLEDIREQLKETKQELVSTKEEAKEEKRRLERKIESLEDEARSLRSQLAIKESEKEVALMRVEAQQKGFLDTEGGQKVIETVASLGQAMFSAKFGGDAPAALGNPGMSESHQNFATILPSLSEEQVNYLGSILALSNNQIFMQQLDNLIHQHHAAN